MLTRQRIKQGQKLTLVYEDREFEVIVIDPNGLGRNQPTIGFGFRMAQRHIGLPEQTLSSWTTRESVFEVDRAWGNYSLKLPSGKRLGLTELFGIDHKRYLVIEASLWVELVADVLEKPGQIKKGSFSRTTLAGALIGKSS